MRRHMRSLVLVALMALATPGCSWRSLISWTGLFRAPRPQMAAPPPVAAPGGSMPSATLSPDEIEGPDAYGLTRAADRAFRQDSLEVAEERLRAALALDPTHAPALSRLSRLFHVTGRHAQAIERLAPVREGTIALSRADRSTLLAGLALHLDALGEWAEAEAVLRLIPSSERVADGGTRVFLMLRGNTPDSAAVLAEAQARTDGRSAAAANNLGIVRLRRGEAEAARKAFLRAIDLDRECAGAYYNLAILEKYYRLDDEEAAKWFDRYRGRSSEDPDSLFAVFGRTETRPLAEREP